ncbi:MAG: NAD(P)H-dependent oxidoreductase [Alphaproteobacteria bacterium]|nr:NAD(P)H-dependent oxidoreductase [Alphaproteobacteria bacterium]
MTERNRVLVIAGSTRARRLCLHIAQWVAGIGRDSISADFEIIDLRDWRLPMDDEPGIPALGDYEFAHTRAWSDKIAHANGFVFVTPQYNWGYPAPLKNALDHLYQEWAGKPAVIVTYGGHGGGKCARQLRQVLRGLKMKPIALSPRLSLTLDVIKANSGVIDPATVFARKRKIIGKAMLRLQSRLQRKAWRSLLPPW